jgi:non-heme chloroperoxidase
MVGSVQVDTIDAANPSGAPVLCLHGLFAGAWVFEHLLPMIAEHGHSASALTYRGRPPNASLPTLGRCSIDDFCDDAREVVRELGRPIVLGHSLGGLIALLLAAGGLVRAAVLVSPAPPRGIVLLSAPLLLRMTRYLPDLLGSRAFLPRAEDLDALVLNAVPAHERPALRALLVPDSGRAARQAALGVHAVPRGAVRVPMLVVAGDRDRFIPISTSRRVATRYGASFHLAHGHGHFLFAEPGWQDEARTILDWITTLPREAVDKSKYREPGASASS